MTYTPNENEISPGKMIPDFSLPDSQGCTVRLSDYRNRSNLVLIFTGPAEEPELRELLDELERFRERFEAEDSEVLMVLPYGQESVGQMARMLEVRIPLVADEAALAHRKFGAGNPDGSLSLMIYVTDRFGEVFNGLRTEKLSEIPRIVEEVYDWLTFIELQCPE